jgi:putative transposase
MCCLPKKRYRLETTSEQENLLARAVGCVRFVWNRTIFSSI